MQETDQAETTKASSTLQAAAGAPISATYSYYALIVLSLLNLLNYIDRSIFNQLIPYIKNDYHYTDEQFGFITGAFTIVYTALSPIYGYFADRRARAGLISSGIAIWSLATALGGVAKNYWQLFFARAAVGIGEASYATISPGFLSDYFDRRSRGLAFGIFFAAVPVGLALGYVLGGQLGDPKMLGWRHTLYLVGLPGLAMALVAHFLREPERGRFDEAEEEADGGGAVHGHGSFSRAEGSVIDNYKTLGKNYHYMVATLGYAAMTFAFGILLVWAPLMLVSDKGLAVNVAGVKLGIYMTLGGLFGTLVGGWLGDLLARWMKGGYFFLCGASAMLGIVPLIIAISSPREAVFFPAIFVTATLLLLGNGPVNAIIVNSVVPGLRATAVATTILVIHILGDVFSAPLVGSISTYIEERSKTGLPLPAIIQPIARMLGLTAEKHLSLAMLAAPVALVVAGCLFFLGIRSGVRNQGSEKLTPDP